jgi:hypothetical protein
MPKKHLFQNAIQEDDDFSDNDKRVTLSCLNLMRASGRLASAISSHYLSPQVS